MQLELKYKLVVMKETNGNTNAVRSLRHYGYFAYKISDVQGSRFTETKPCDIIVCSPKGRFGAIEGKIMKRWATFNKKVLRPNQIMALDAVSKKRQGRAWIFLYVHIKAKGHRPLHRLVVLDWTIFRPLIMGQGIGVQQLRAQTIGIWLTPMKVQKKDVYRNLDKALVSKLKNAHL